MTVRVEKNGAVWTVVHDRPEARNAMDPASADALIAAFLEFDADKDACVAVFYGAGGAFCAGWDLKYVSTLNFDYPLGELDIPVAGPRGCSASSAIAAQVVPVRPQAPPPSEVHSRRRTSPTARADHPVRCAATSRRSAPLLRTGHQRRQPLPRHRQVRGQTRCCRTPGAPGSRGCRSAVRRAHWDQETRERDARGDPRTATWSAGRSPHR